VTGAVLCQMVPTALQWLLCQGGKGSIRERKRKEVKEEGRENKGV